MKYNYIIMLYSLAFAITSMHPSQNSDLGKLNQQINQQMNELHTITTQGHQHSVQQLNYQLMESQNQRSVNMYQSLEQTIPDRLIEQMHPADAAKARFYNNSLFK